MTTVRRSDDVGSAAGPRSDHRARWALLGSAGLLALGTPLLAGATAGATVAPPATVVRAAPRGTLGDILVTQAGATLYEDTAGPCTGGCASVWPPLTVPAGSKLKAGPGVLRADLGTTRVSGVRVVTYDGHALYTFVDDSGHSANGNGDGPFVVVPVPST